MEKCLKRLFAVLLSVMILLGSIPGTVRAAVDSSETGTAAQAEGLYVQEYVKSGWNLVEGEQKWYPNEEGIIEIPALDRAFSFGEYGIRIKGIALDMPNTGTLDFSVLSGGEEKTLQTSGKVTLSNAEKSALDLELQEEQQVDIPFYYQEGADGEKLQIVTLRFLNMTDEQFNQSTEELNIYYTPVNGEKQLIEEGEQLTISLPEDGNGGHFSYEGLVEEEGYSYEWQTSGESGGFNGDIRFDWFIPGKLVINRAGTATISLVRTKDTVGETLFSCEVKVPSGTRMPTTVAYVDGTEGNKQEITDTMDLYLRKGDAGSFQVAGDDVEGKTLIWKTDSDSSITIQEDGRITAEGAGCTKVTVTDETGTPAAEFLVYVLDLSVSFTGTYAGELQVEEGDTVEVASTETGTFSASGAQNVPEGIRLKWVNGGDYQRPITISSYEGKLYVNKPGTIDAWLVMENSETLETSIPLYNFSVNATDKTVEDVKVKVDGKEIRENNLIRIEGSEYKELTILGRFSGADDFVEISSNAYKLSTDTDVISVDDSASSCGFRFEKPGSGTITVVYGEETFSFRAESSYVAIESLTLDLPDEDENTPGRQILMHELVYRFGDADNYVGIDGVKLARAYTVKPANASYARNISWSNDNEAIATYEDTNMNGFVGHDAGSTTITASIGQETYGEKVTKSQEVSFCYQYPVEALESEIPDLTVETGKKVELDLQFTPSQPSQGLIKWEQSGTGEVEVQRDKNGQYDSYSNLKYRVKGIKAGTVTLTGTPVSAKEGTDPRITYTIQVTGEETEIPEGSDTSEIVKGLIETAEKYYDAKPVTWAYGEEWNVIAMKRAGISMDKANEEIAITSYLDSVKDEIADPEGKLSTDAKPTDLARVIMALYSLEENPRDFAETDLVERLLNSDRLDQGSNEVIWALLILDAVGEKVPEGSSWTRGALVSEILEYQCEDGSFGLSKSDKTGSVDMTAMALQGLAAYQNKNEVKTATERALNYLREKIQEGDYKTAESDAQVAVALLMLGMDPCDKVNGFAEDDVTIYQAMDQYRAEEGGFKHQQSGVTSDKMATQQVLLAAAAWERYSAGENSIYDMTDVASPVDPEDPENPDPEEPSGYVTVAVEKFSIGQGYLVEPELVPVYKDMTAAEVITRYLEDHNLEYEHTGTIEDSFYLSAVKDTKGSKTAVFPETTKKYAQENKIQLKEGRRKDYLGEFDYSNGSGWKYTVNDDMTDQGMSQMKLKDGDVVRVSFTAIALGQDLGNKEGSFMPVTNRDALTKMLAEINSSDRKEEILASPNVRAAYLSAIQTISDLEENQESIDEAVANLKEAQENPEDPSDIDEAVQNVISLIEAIGNSITLESKEAIEKARTAYDALTDVQKKLVTNLELLEAAEDAYAKLNQEYLQEQKEKAKDELDSYKDPAEYRKEEQEELKSIIEAGKKAIEEAQDMAGIVQAKEAAMKKMDEVKTKEELEAQENKDPVTLRNSQYMISVTGENLTRDMELQVIPLTAEQEAVTVMRKKIPSSKALIKPYEIRIVKDQKETEIKGPFTVEYQMDRKYNGKELQVFLVDGQNKVTEVKGIVKENVLSVNVNVLGSMAIVVDSSAVSSDQVSNTSGNSSKGGQSSSGGSSTAGSGSVKTGDTAATMSLIWIMILSAIAAAASGLKKKISGKR